MAFTLHLLKVLQILFCLNFIAASDICPVNQVFVEKPCSKTCLDMFFDNCVPLSSAGCQCELGYLKNSYGECVSSDKCDKVKCPENMNFEINSCTITCKRHLFKEKCQACEDCKQPRCACKTGYYLHSNGQCVQSEACRADPEVCGPHGTFEQQPCNNQCAKMFTGTQCVVSKKPGCQCNEGYFTNSRGQCVLPQECDNVKCPKRAYFDPWPFGCQVTCQNMLLDQPCYSETITPNCVCMSGYVENAEGVCINPVKCPSKEIECPNNLVYDECGNRHHIHCGEDCHSVNKNARCIPACYCTKDRVYDDVTGFCVEEHECINSYENIACRSIDPLLRYEHCHNGPVKTCMNLHADQPVQTCEAGCYCIDGYFLDKWNHCVTAEMCPVEVL